MYRRYSSTPTGNGGENRKINASGTPQFDNGSTGRFGQNQNAYGAYGKGTNNRIKPPHQPHQSENNYSHSSAAGKKKPSPVSPLLKFIPQSIYNPETGKVLGILSAEDLLIAALILVLIDNRDDGEDNSLLIYALVYILISDRINLPF